MAEQDDGSMFVTGVASSAGGLEALVELLQNAFCHKSMTFVLVPHLDRHYETNLPKLLGRISNLPAKVITHGMQLEHCRLHILPANHYVEMRGNRLFLVERPVGGVNQAANILFKSLAKSHGPNAIGVVLSGASVGADGAEGIVAIKEAGGHTYAQTPSTARYPDMPRLAIETGCVDSVLSAAEIGHELTLVNWAMAQAKK